MSHPVRFTNDDAAEDVTDMADSGVPPPPVWSCRIYLVIVLFSVSANLGLDALWVTSPVSARHQPEGHRTSAYLVVFTVIGNVGPIAYLVTRRCAARPLAYHEVVPIYVCLLVAVLAAGVLALFWDKQDVLRYGDYSVIYLTAALCLALVACVGTTAYMPFVATMHARYVTAVLMGEALAGLIPHLVAIGQGIGEPPACRPPRPANRTWGIPGWRARLQPSTTLAPAVPPPLRFNESIYFFTITGVLCIASFCFLILRCIPSVREQYDWDDGDDRDCGGAPWMPVCDDDGRVGGGGGGYGVAGCGGYSHRRNRHLQEAGIEEDNEVLLNAQHQQHQQHQNQKQHEQQHEQQHVQQQVQISSDSVILDHGSIRHSAFQTSCVSGSEKLANHPYITTPGLSLNGGGGGRNHGSRLRPVNTTRPLVGDGGTSLTDSGAKRREVSSPFRRPSTCLMMAFTLWACLVVNGPLSSAHAHSCIPLGNRAFQSGTLMTKVAAVLAVLVTLRVNPYSRVTMVVAFTSLGTIVLTYFVALISFSHESGSKEDSPIFMNTGELLSTIAWASVTGLFFFTKAMVAILLRQHQRSLLVWYAAVSQLGVTLGALFMLDDISICRIYRDYEQLYCQAKSSS